MLIALLGILYGTTALSDEVIEDFEGAFSWTGFGAASTTVEQTSDLANTGASSMRIIVNNPFDSGFGIGVTKPLSPVVSTTDFSSISYWIQSSNNDTDRTVAIQLVDGSGNTITQHGNTQLSLAGRPEYLGSSGGSFELTTAGFSGTSNFDLTNIAQVDILLLRNNATSDARTLFVDDIEFITGDHSHPSRR